MPFEEPRMRVPRQGAELTNATKLPRVQKSSSPFHDAVNSEEVLESVNWDVWIQLESGRIRKFVGAIESVVHGPNWLGIWE